VRAPRCSSRLSYAYSPCVRRSRPPKYFVFMLASSLFFALIFVFPLSLAAATEVASAGAGASPESLIHKDRWIIAAVALFFALLSLLKDFRRYRGLLHTLLWNGYSWLFLAFTAMSIFAIDYIAWQVLQQHTTLVRNDEVMGHISLILGHSTISAAFVYASPFILRVIPAESKAPNQGPVPEKPEKDKPATEMNVIFAAIRDSLETLVNGKVRAWSIKYSWPVIKVTGKMLLTDLLMSEVISKEDFDRALSVEDAHQPCADLQEDNYQKYKLLRLMMSRCSYYTLKERLECAAAEVTSKPSGAAA
jgi:hypothetical protein